MKFNVPKFLFATGTAVFLIAAARNQAQPTPVGHATDFTSVQYFEPPDDQKVKIRLSGAEALPLPDAMLDVKQLKMEVFNTNGNPQVVVKAPQCTYALDGVASSPGPLELVALDGKFRVEGVGFLWRQSEQSLSISNRVRTTIDINIFSEQKSPL
jgi:hypothetical protein